MSSSAAPRDTAGRAVDATTTSATADPAGTNQGGPDARDLPADAGATDASADPTVPEPSHGATATDDPTPRRSRLAALIAVTKPRIIELLLVTTVPTMVVAANGWPGTALLIATVIGGTLSAAGANSINNWYDRDVDARMNRTANRPTVRGELGANEPLVLGIGLGVAGFVVLLLGANLLAAALATFGLLFYVFVYTMLLKRRSPQAVVIGGIAGCMPVLTGWAAVTGDLTAAMPWLLFGLLFWWQPPHFWALAMKYREDYATAGLPMMPVSWGNDETTRQILLHSWLMLPLVVMTIIGGPTGAMFAVPALALTAGWIWLATRLRRTRTVSHAMRLFHYSTVYLAALFILAAADALL